MKNQDWTQNQINADIALKNRLYVSGWMLSSHLKAIRDGRLNSIVKLHYEDGKPFAVITANKPYEGFDSKILDTNTTNLEIFVKKIYRNKGIGRKLVSELGNSLNFGSLGIDGSQQFWEKVGVRFQY